MSSIRDAGRSVDAAHGWRHGRVVDSFRRLADGLAPDVLAMPYFQVSAKEMGDDEVARFARDLRLVARGHARPMRWDA